MVARRLLALIPVLLLVSFGTFALVLAVPGNAAQTIAGGENASAKDIARVTKRLHLDDPLLSQYGRWLGHAAQLDFGDSLVTGDSVAGQIADKTPITISIVAMAMLVALLIGATSGVIAGSRAGTASDKASVLVATLAVSIPSFVIAILLIRFFAIELRWVPAIGFTPFSESIGDWFRSVILPSLALGTIAAGALSRQLRSGLVESLSSDYVRTSWAIGGSARVAVGKHALRNAVVPSVAVLGIQVSGLLGSMVIIENIFSIRGIGTYLYEAVYLHDLPVIQGVVVWFVLVQLTINLLVDIALALLNPRLRVT